MNTKNIFLINLITILIVINHFILIRCNDLYDYLGLLAINLTYISILILYKIKYKFKKYSIEVFFSSIIFLVIAYLNHKESNLILLLSNPVFILFISLAIVYNTFIIYTLFSETILERINSYIPILILILFNSIFIVFNYESPLWDQSRHSRNVFTIYNSFCNGTGLFELFRFYDFYPPITYICTFPLIFLFGKNYTALSLSITLFWLPISYVFIKRFCNEILNSTKSVGSCIAFILLSTPMILSINKQFLIDFPPVCMTIVFIFYVIKSNFFKNYRYTILAGVSFGIGFLTKQNFIVYVITPLLFIILFVLLNFFKGKDNDKVSLGILLFVIFICFSCGFWLFDNGGMYFYELSGQKLNAISEGDPEPGTIKSYSWYLNWFIYDFNLYVIIAWLAGVFLEFIKKEKANPIINYGSIASVLFIYFAMTSQWNKDPRYIIGIIIFFIPGLFFWFKQNKIINQIVIAVLCLVSIMNIIGQVYGDSIIFNKLNIQQGYVLPKSPVNSTHINQSEAISVMKKLLSKTFFNQNILIYENLATLGQFGFNEFSLASQELVINKDINNIKYTKDTINERFITLYNFNKNIIKIKSINNKKYYFLRDSILNCYFLISLMHDSINNKITLEKYTNKTTLNIQLNLNLKIVYQNGYFEQKNLMNLLDVSEIQLLPFSVNNLSFSTNTSYVAGLKDFAWQNLLFPYKNFLPRNSTSNCINFSNDSTEFCSFIYKNPIKEGNIPCYLLPGITCKTIKYNKSIFGKIKSTKNIEETGNFVFGPYTNLVKGNYLITYYLMTDNVSKNFDIATIDVCSDGKVLVSKNINTNNFKKANEFCKFDLYIESDIPFNKTEFRIFYHGKYQLFADKICYKKL